MSVKKKVVIDLNLMLLLSMFLAILKLNGNIDVSWFWVTAPLFAPFALLGGLALSILVIAATSAILNALRIRK